MALRATKATQYANAINKAAGGALEATTAGVLKNYAEGKMMGLETYDSIQTKLRDERSQGQNALTDAEIKSIAADAADDVVAKNRWLAVIDIGQMGLA